MIPTTLAAEVTTILDRARAADPKDWNAMCLATVAADGRPSARFVLLKEFDARGFVFYTNLESRKSLQLLANPVAALTFYWGRLEEQLRAEGAVEAVSGAEADAYFASRPRGSQLGAWASDQSRPLDARSTLEQRLADVERTYAGRDVPRPGHWSGFRLVPDRIEIWKGQPSRLHDRAQHRLVNGEWVSERLFP